MSRPPVRRPPPARNIHAALSAQLVARQLLLLLAAGTALLFVCFFFDYYGAFSFWSMWEEQPYVDFKIVQLPALIVLIYGYVGIGGVLFTLTPSEKNFNFFFGWILLALGITAADNSTIDWVTIMGGVVIRNPNPVSAPKILAAGALLLVVAVMHYNILSDDFVRRMIRRGVPTSEVAPVRHHMMQVLLPTMGTAIMVAFGLALLGEFSSFIFGGSGSLLPKLELALLAALIVPIAFLIRSILRELAGVKNTERKRTNR